ncbi:uncharacterized protein LOC118735031 [Rhagoletis pomonella]|uniref:uncharacterized protein LOC118735031 n=1 Tax=Rhagoletis pomonella TaxID=28610 RepID=UPI00177BA80B|nr:uncharacterized protein LOC118735031 [Rhagoletis pomonella]
MADIYQCQLCCRFHPLQACAWFRRMTVDERKEAVRVHKYCGNCLARSHSTRACPSRNTCRVCKLSHHTLLHRTTDKTPARISSAVTIVPPRAQKRQCVHTRICLCHPQRTNTTVPRSQRKALNRDGKEGIFKRQSKAARPDRGKRRHYQLDDLVTVAATSLRDLQQHLNRFAPVQGGRHDHDENGGNLITF